MNCKVPGCKSRATGHLCIAHGEAWLRSWEIRRAFDFGGLGTPQGSTALMDFVRRIEAEERNSLGAAKKLRGEG